MGGGQTAQRSLVREPGGSGLGIELGGMSFGAEPGTRCSVCELGALSHGGKRLGLDAGTRIGHGLGPNTEAGGSMGGRHVNGENARPFSFSRSERRKVNGHSTLVAKDWQ